MEVCFIEYMDVIQILLQVDEAMRCVCLRWDTEEEYYYRTFLFGSAPTESSLTMVPWYGTEPIRSSLGVVLVLRANYEMHRTYCGATVVTSSFCDNMFYVPT